MYISYQSLGILFQGNLVSQQLKLGKLATFLAVHLASSTTAYCQLAVMFHLPKGVCAHGALAAPLGKCDKGQNEEAAFFFSSSSSRLHRSTLKFSPSPWIGLQFNGLVDAPPCAGLLPHASTQDLSEIIVKFKMIHLLTSWIVLILIFYQLKIIKSLI